MRERLMSDLFPSFTIMIVCLIIGVGFAYAFYTFIHNQALRYWGFIPFAFILAFFSDFSGNMNMGATKVITFFIIALFIGLVSTPIDD